MTRRSVEFDRFESLLRRLLGVPKTDVDKLRRTVAGTKKRRPPIREAASGVVSRLSIRRTDAPDQGVWELPSPSPFADALPGSLAPPDVIPGRLL